MKKFQSSRITIDNLNASEDFDAKVYNIGGISDSYFARADPMGKLSLFYESGNPVSDGDLAGLKDYLPIINSTVRLGEPAVITYAVGLSPDMDSAYKLRNFPKDSFVKNVGVLNFMEIKKYASGMTTRFDVPMNLKAEQAGSGLLTQTKADGSVVETPKTLRSTYFGRALVRGTVESNRSFLEQTAIDLYNKL